MFKRISRQPLVMALLALCCLPVSAQNAVKMIESNGEETVFLLSTHPKVSLSQSVLEIKTDTDEITCDIDEGVRFELIDFEDASVNDIEEDKPVFKVSKERVEAFNLKPGSDVKLYDLTGKIMESVKTDSTGHAALDISVLPDGIYIINSSNRNFKFYKK